MQDNADTAAPVHCSYCGRKVAKNRRPFVKRKFFADGSDWRGHKSCWLEMSHPDDPTVGHARHKIGF